VIARQAFRYELAPNAAQRVLSAKHAGCARFAWNWALGERIFRNARSESRRSSLSRDRCAIAGRDRECQGEARFTNAIEQHRELNARKGTEWPWMYEVSKCAPQEALRDLDRAFRNFVRARRAGRAFGFPRFKRKGIDDAFRLTGSIRVRSRTVQLPRLGAIRTKEGTQKFQGRILSATVRREAERWYVSLTVEAERPDPEPIVGPVAGVDLGLHSFATISDGVGGEVVAAPKPLGCCLRRLRRRSRAHSCKTRGSSNRRQSAVRLARLHRRIRNMRVDFLHKLSTRLAKTKSVVVLEQLNVRGLVRNGHLARHISDAGWGDFRRMLEYKSRWYGSKVVLAPRFLASSKTCSECGHVLESLALSHRKWICPACGVEHDRDSNAARNLVAWYQRATGSSPGSDACGEPSGGAEAQAPASHGSAKQESAVEDWSIG
jgi:putative transposase